jgi:hypothetical protein
MCSYLVETALKPNRTLKRQDRIFAHTDESGNSGLDLFDHQQPTFWTGTLIAEQDIDLSHPKVIEATIARAGVIELHGNHLGLGGIEKIGSRLRYLILKFDLHFIFTRIEKEFLVGTKFMDTVCDAGNNKAVAPHIYNVKLTRLYFLNVILGCMTDTDKRDFWQSYRDEDRALFAKVLIRVQAKIKELVVDPRTKQLLNDAFEWGAQHPEDLLTKMSNLDSPNVVALTSIIQKLHEYYEDTGKPVAQFIHDEQNQFAKSMHFAYDLIKPFTIKTTATALLPEIKDAETFKCELVERSSKASFGLQMIDTLLWLAKRKIDRNIELRGECKSLFDLVLQRSLITDYSRNELTRWLLTEGNQFLARPISAEQLEKGKAIAAELEQKRIHRMGS